VKLIRRMNLSSMSCSIELNKDMSPGLYKVHRSSCNGENSILARVGEPTRKGNVSFVLQATALGRSIEQVHECSTAIPEHTGSPSTVFVYKTGLAFAIHHIGYSRPR
jgi:hypothetical protein